MSKVYTRNFSGSQLIFRVTPAILCISLLPPKILKFKMKFVNSRATPDATPGVARKISILWN